MYKNNLLLCLLGIFFIHASAQQELKKNVCYQLVDYTSNKVIPYAHIYNESKRYGAIADSVGRFSITASEGDTIILMALGYLGTTHKVQEHDFDTCNRINLDPRSYKIEQVEVSIPRSYEQFQHEIMNLKDEDKVIEELPEHNPYKTPEVLDTNITHKLGYMIMHPVSGLYYRFSKEEKSKRQVWYLQQQELRQEEVDEKYNRDIVSEITGYKDDELTQFMGFCNFSFNYLLETNHYDIILAIEEKQHEYITCCYDKHTRDSIAP